LIFLLWMSFLEVGHIPPEGERKIFGSCFSPTGCPVCPRTQFLEISYKVARSGPRPHVAGSRVCVRAERLNSYLEVSLFQACKGSARPNQPRRGSRPGCRALTHRSPLVSLG
jgi:hypothetical protein